MRNESCCFSSFFVVFGEHTGMLLLLLPGKRGENADKGEEEDDDNESDDDVEDATTDSRCSCKGRIEGA